MADEQNETLLTLTADIVAAHVSNNNVALADLATMIERVHGALAGLGAAPVEAEPELKPAVSVRASVKSDHLVCLEDGKKMKMLRRHLATDHGLTPDEYRAKWGLPASYPMVASDYSERRRVLAKEIGLGMKGGRKASITKAKTTPATAASTRRGRSPKAPVA